MSKCPGHGDMSLSIDGIKRDRPLGGLTRRLAFCVAIASEGS